MAVLGIRQYRFALPTKRALKCYCSLTIKVSAIDSTYSYVFVFLADVLKQPTKRMMNCLEVTGMDIIRANGDVH